MNILVTSASGANGAGQGELLAFTINGELLGAFSDDARIADPRGLKVSADKKILYVNSGADLILGLAPDGKVVLDSGYIPGLNAGGGILGPRDFYYVGLRSERTIMAFPLNLDGRPTPIIGRGVVPFPRGFAFIETGELFLASGIGPDGRGANTILRFDSAGMVNCEHFVMDSELSPLDMTIGPNGNLVVSSEFPFGAQDAITSIREYDYRSGTLVRVFYPPQGVHFRRPRGLRLGPEGNLYCVSQDNVLAFDFERGKFVGVAVTFPNLHGQAIEFFGD